MTRVLKDNFQHLYDVADSQGGFFTAKQAGTAGYSTRMQTYHVQNGDWQREWRGIYRLRFYPQLRPDDLMIWYLWSANSKGDPDGVYSHDTALELHELSTWTGSRLHMTVPKDFKRRLVPEALRLHRADLRHYEISRVGQVAVTTAARTLIDLLNENSVQRHHLLEAMQDARKRGLITPTDLKNPVWTTKERALLEQLTADSLSYKTEA